MDIKKSNKVIYGDNCVDYIGGYNVRLTLEELYKIEQYLIAEKQKAKVEINTWVRDNLSTKVNFGYNYFGVTTFKFIENLFNDVVPFKRNGNRFINFIVTDLTNSKKYKGFEVGQEIIMNDAKNFNGVELKKGSSYIIVDFPIGYGNKNKLIRTLPKYPNNTENVRDFINDNERLVAFLPTEISKL